MFPKKSKSRRISADGTRDKSGRIGWKIPLATKKVRISEEEQNFLFYGNEHYDGEEANDSSHNVNENLEDGIMPIFHAGNEDEDDNYISSDGEVEPPDQDNNSPPFNTGSGQICVDNVFKDTILPLSQVHILVSSCTNVINNRNKIFVIHHLYNHQERIGDSPIVQTIKQKLNSLRPQQFPPDANEPFDMSWPEGPTKKEFAEMFTQVAIKNSLTEEAQCDILKLLRDATRKLNIPAKPATKATKRANIVRSDVKRYLEEDTRDITLQACKNGCMTFFDTTFVEETQELVDNSKLIHCLYCKAPRFSHCNHRDCRDLLYDECNPFVDIGQNIKDSDPQRATVKKHSDKYRIPMDKVHYRSITTKLIQLYLVSLTAGNSDLLNYHLPSKRIWKPGKIIDVNDGGFVQEQRSIMSDNFRSYFQEYKNQFKADLIELSICYTFFFDGITNFDRAFDSMWPLLISVLNCNPSDRTKLGVGLFLAAMHNVNHDSGVEKHLLSVLADEMEALENGVVFIVFGENGEPDKHVFLQARCVYAHLDTKAIESLGMVQGAFSAHGSSLAKGHRGLWIYSLSRFAYINSRRFLPPNHVMRYVGNFPINKVNDNILDECFTWSNKQDVDGQRQRKAFQAQLLQDSNQEVAFNDKDYKNSRPPPPNKTSLNKNINLSERTDLVWFSKTHSFKDMIKWVSFLSEDHRPQLFPERYDKVEWVVNGLAARVENDKQDANNRRKLENNPNYEIPESQKAKVINGLRGLCALLEKQLQSFTSDNFGFDLMHLLKNLFNYIMEHWKGERGLDEATRRMSLAIGAKHHLYLTFTKSLAPYQISKRCQSTVDAVINTLLIPVAYTRDYKIKYPMQQSGYVQSYDAKVFLMVFMKYALSFTTMDEDYKKFYSRVSEDIIQVLNPIIDIETLEDLFDNVCESKCCFEGLFPLSEQAYVFHQLMDIVAQIKKYGHVSGLMCFFGERALGRITSLISKGGVHYLKTLYYRYLFIVLSVDAFLSVAMMFWSVAVFLSAALFFLFVLKMLFTLFGRYVHRENIPLKDYIKNNMFYDNRGIYSDFVLRLLGPNNVYCEWDVVEKNNLFESLVIFLDTQEINDLYLISPFWRLYNGYKQFYLINPLLKIGFYQWVQQLRCAYDDDENQQSLVGSHMTALISDNNGVYDNNCVSDGKIYLQDFLALHESILKFNPSVYYNVIVKGIVIKCRGEKYAERYMNELNDVNDLQLHWFQKNHYSSWCRVSYWKLQENSGTVTQSTRFGQLNFSFRVSMQQDPLIHGLAFANITMRKSTLCPIRHHHCVSALDGAQSHDSSIKFVSMNYIDSTAIGVSALNEEDKAMHQLHHATSFSHANKTSSSRGGSYSRMGSRLAKLYLIELHPERLQVMYGTVLEDVDGTKVWEKENI